MLKSIATRQRRWDWDTIWGYLPDPDEVLQKTSNDISAYRSLLNDGHVWACYESRKSGTLSKEWKITAPLNGRVSDNHLKIATEMLLKHDVNQITNEMLDAVFFGMVPIEITWEKGEQWTPLKIEGKPAEWFVFDYDNNLRFISVDTLLEGEPLPDKKFLLPRSHASYQNPYGQKALARCFWPVTFKKGGWQFWSVCAEKYGVGWAVGKVPRNTPEADRERMKDNLAAMVQDAVTVINNDETIEPGMGGSANADIYRTMIEAADREISKAILGQNLTTEVSEGSYAASKTHEGVLGLRFEQDKKMCTRQYNTLLSWFWELNFGLQSGSGVFQFIESEDLQKERAERDALLVNQGIKFTEQYFSRTYNFQEGDFEIRIPAEPEPQTIESKEKPPGEFADAKSKTNLADKPDAVDQLTVESEKQAQDAMDAMLRPVMEFIDGASSLDDIAEKLYTFYPKMDTQSFQELMARAQFQAAARGAVDAI